MTAQVRRRNSRAGRRVRQTAQRVLVVTEGTETEPQYIERLNGYLRSKSASAFVKAVGVGKDPLKVVQKCIEYRDRAAARGKSFDICVCLVDVDRHATLQQAAELASKESILMIVSNLKFETWLRWHVENKRSALTTAQLDELMKKLELVQNKSLPTSFPFEGVHAACDVARQADPGMKPGRTGPDPSSSMPILVDLLLGKQSGPAANGR